MPAPRLPGPPSGPNQSLRLFDPTDEDDGYLTRDPSQARDPSPTLREICDAFICRFERLVVQGERSGRTLTDYRLASADLLGVLGDLTPIAALRPADFGRLRDHLAARVGKKALSGRINSIRTILRSAGELRDEAGLPRFRGAPDYGLEFQRPSAAVIRRDRRHKRSRSFTPAEIRSLLLVAREPLRTMVLLGANGGLGNTDIAQLTWPALSLDGDRGWLDFPRPKTAVDRRIPLWPETCDALRRRRGLKAGDADLVFLTGRGLPWVRTHPDGRHADALVKQFAKLRRRAGIEADLGFYGLRHSFQTIGDESRDPHAVSAIMGHVDGSMAGAYRDPISEPRLIHVVETVRRIVILGIEADAAAS